MEVYKLNDHNAIADKIEYTSIDASIKKMAWQVVPRIIKNSLKGFFSAPIKFIFSFILMGAFVYLGGLFWVLQNRHDAFSVLSVIFFIISPLFIYGLVSSLIAILNKEKVHWGYLFQGFKNKPIEQIFLVILPSLYLFAIGFVLTQIGAYEVVEDTFRYGHYDDLGWVFLMFSVVLAFLLPGILWFYFAIYLLVSGEKLESEFEFNDFITRPVVAIKKNFFKLWLVFYLYFLIFGVLVVIFIPMIVVANIVFLALVVNFGREIFVLTDKKVII